MARRIRPSFKQTLRETSRQSTRRCFPLCKAWVLPLTLFETASVSICLLAKIWGGSLPGNFDTASAPRHSACKFLRNSWAKTYEVNFPQDDRRGVIEIRASRVMNDPFIERRLITRGGANRTTTRPFRRIEAQHVLRLGVVETAFRNRHFGMINAPITKSSITRVLEFQPLSSIRRGGRESGWFSWCVSPCFSVPIRKVVDDRGTEFGNQSVPTARPTPIGVP